MYKNIDENETREGRYNPLSQTETETAIGKVPCHRKHPWKRQKFNPDFPYPLLGIALPFLLAPTAAQSPVHFPAKGCAMFYAWLIPLYSEPSR